MVYPKFLGSDEVLGLKTVTGCSLPVLKGNQRKATGKGDLIVGKRKELELASSTETYTFSFGHIELKEDIYPIKTAQNILELASLATVIRVGMNCSLLATDCNTKWEL